MQEVHFLTPGVVARQGVAQEGVVQQGVVQQGVVQQGIVQQGVAQQRVDCQQQGQDVSGCRTARKFLSIVATAGAWRVRLRLGPPGMWLATCKGVQTLERA